MTAGLDKLQEQVKIMSIYDEQAPWKKDMQMYKQERDQNKEDYLKALEEKVQLEQAIRDLKYQLDNKEQASTIRQRPANDQDLYFDCGPELVRQLEARIQQLTEDNDDLRRDLELARKNGEENDYWVDNQMELMDRCNDLADVIRARDVEIKQLKEQQDQQVFDALELPGEPEPQRMQTTNANLRKHLFKVQKEPEEQIPMGRGNQTD